MSKAILVVDDTRSMRAMVAAVLQGAGYEVAEAGDGVEALELARQRVFDGYNFDRVVEGVMASIESVGKAN
jgi:CheY-like chemotaxis protein